MSLVYAPPAGSQFLRRYSLVVGNDQLQVDLSQLRFRFKIHSNDVETPNHAEITVTNLNPATSQQIQAEFTKVTLQAGYVNGPYGTVFQGDIREFKRGKENPTDTFLTLLAADGDQAYTKGVVNATVAAGTTPADHVSAIVGSVAAALGAAALGVGPLIGLSAVASIRGKTLYGMARDALRSVANSSGLTWSIQNGLVTMLPKGGALAGSTVTVLNSRTGMVGIPQQTVDGIVVRSLLNPNVVIGSLVQIDQNDVVQTVAARGNQLSTTPGLTSFLQSGSYTNVQTLVVPPADGLYRVMAIDREGDTRGNPWYNEMICLPVDGSVSPNASSKVLINLPGQ